MGKAIPGLGEEGTSIGEWVRISSLHGWADNPKQHPEKQILKLCASLEEFGWGAPIVARARKDRELMIGHGRMLAAHRLGVELAPLMAQLQASGRKITQAMGLA